MKTIFNKALLYGTLMTLLAASCTNDEDSSTEKRIAIRVSAGVSADGTQTRAAGNAWNENDVIGISMIDPQNGAVWSPYNNYDYTTGGDGNFSPTGTDKIIYLPVQGEKVTFKAYYPYKTDTPDNLLLPVSVKSQTSLADLDLMTAEHLSGTSIDDPNVKLHFYHRLAKVIVDLTTDETGLIDLKDCKLAIKGLKSTASYDLLKESLSIDEASTADIDIPIHNAEGEAILLPRAAAQGVTFEVTTADGGIYTARMAEDVELKAGYKHTFHIRLRSTPVTVSATIEEWAEGPERKIDVVRLVTGLKDTEGFKPDDTLLLFLKDEGQSDFGYASTFTYGTDDKWTTPTPLYWEDITADPATFRGATVFAPKLNDTQMDDILVSKDASVAQYTGVNLEMQHAGSQVIIELKSTDGSFSTAQLKDAGIVLPDYLNSGSLNPETGAFVPGSVKADITPEGGIAIFPPQTIANGGLIAKINIDGRIYDVKATEPDGFEYQAGVSNKLTFDIKKSEVEMSAVIADWNEEVHEFKDVSISTATLGSNGGDLNDGDRLLIYTGNETQRVQKGEHFSYNKAVDKWTYSNAQQPLYWEDIPVTDRIYGFIERPAISTTPGSNQSADYIITPRPVENGGGATNTALHLQMEHAVAKVIVVLQSKTYSLDELNTASVVLPAYTTGGAMDNGIYMPGSTTADITLDKLAKDTENRYITDAAYLQAQDIAAGTTIVKLTIGGRIYEARKETEVIKYEAGKATTLILNIEKSGLAVSATVAGWDTKPAVEFPAILSFEVKNPASSGFTDGDKITIYKVDGADKVEDSNDSYAYNNSAITSPTPWYRDDFATGDKINAVFPNTPAVADGSNTMNWSSEGGNAHDKDVLVATNGIIKDNDTEVSLDFKHVLSKITVNLIAGDGFVKDELTNGTVTLNNLVKEGTINIADGTTTAGSTATGDVSTAKLSTPNTVDGKDVAASYEAFIMPQTFTVSGKKTLITVTLDGKKYEAELNAEKVFVGGEHYVYNITLSKAGLTFSATVSDWNLGKGGDFIIQ